MTTKSLTSRLVMEVVDRVTGPARTLTGSILGIQNAAQQAGGAGLSGFGARLTSAIDANNAALDAARGRLFDAVAGFYALRAAIASPVAEAAAFESAMADVRKVVDFTEDSYAAFKDGLLDLSKDVPYAVNGLAAIAAAAGQAGIAGEELVRFTEAAAKIGTAFDVSAEQAGDDLAKLMTGLGITLDEAMLLADAMNHLSNSQASTAAEIMDVVRRVGGQAKMFGFTSEQTAAFASAMIAAGAESEVAATSFRNMGKALTRGTAATGRQRAAFEALGMDATEVANQMQKDAVGTTVQVLEAISRIPKEQQAAIASDLFGDEARALGPLLTNLDLVRSSLGLVANESDYAGSAFREFEARSRTFEAAMQRFQNVLSALRITIGNALIPIFTELMLKIGPVVEKVTDWIGANPQLVGGLLAAAAGVTAFKVAMAGLTFLGLLGRGGALSMLAFGFNTVGRAAASIRGAAGGMIALQTALAAMDGQKVGLFAKLAAGLRGVAAVTGLTAAKGAIAAVVGVVATISAPAWAAIAAAVAAVGLAWKYWDRITSFVSGVGEALGEILSPALEAIRPVLEWFAPLGELIAAGWEKAKAAVSAVGEWLGSIFGKEALSEEDNAAAKQSGYDFIMALWDGMKQVVSDLLAWLRGVADQILAPFKSLGETIRSYLPGGGGAAAFSESFDVGGGVDGARAKGGPISRGGRYLVGEEGPELITASRSGYVNPAGSGGGRNMTVNFGGIVVHAQSSDPAAVAREVRRELEAAFREAFNGMQADTGLSTY
jgi:TP901 family phage tail tape measure protein